MVQIADLDAAPETIEATLNYFVDTGVMPVSMVGAALPGVRAQVSIVGAALPGVRALLPFVGAALPAVRALVPRVGAPLPVLRTLVALVGQPVPLGSAVCHFRVDLQLLGAPAALLIVAVPGIWQHLPRIGRGRLRWERRRSPAH